jgi:hypothetical protein
MQYDDAVFWRRLRQNDLWRKLFPAEHEAEAGVRYLEPPDAAKFTNLSTTFLARARVDGNGPKRDARPRRVDELAKTSDDKGCTGAITTCAVSPGIVGQNDAGAELQFSRQPPRTAKDGASGENLTRGKLLGKFSQANPNSAALSAA